MFVFTLRDVLGVVFLGLALVFWLVVVVLYKIAESIEKRKNKRLEKMWKERDRNE